MLELLIRYVLIDKTGAIAMPFESNNPYSAPTVPGEKSRTGRPYKPSFLVRVAAFLSFLFIGYIGLNLSVLSLHGYWYFWSRRTQSLFQLFSAILLVSAAVALVLLAFYWLAFALTKNQHIAKLRFVALTASLILIVGVLTYGWMNGIGFF